jgi:hypothetical protein
MTTYNYTITLNDREVLAVQEALRLYIILYKPEINSKLTPEINASSAAQAVIERLFLDTTMTSTSSFCWPERPEENPG